MKTPYHFSLVFVLLTLSMYSTAAVHIVLEKPRSNNSIEKQIYERLQTSPTTQTVTAFLNDTFHTREDIAIHFGHYGRIWYENNKIEIPYEFIQRMRNGYQNANFPHHAASLDEFTGNTLLHVIFHEMAHAFIEQYNLPVLGKPEDAADGLADVLLLYFFDEGDNIVISAADLFYMKSTYKRRLTTYDYWSEHSLDLQRYYARICHVYGSNPSKHQALVKRTGFDEIRAERCIIQYKDLERGWLTVLQPAFKNTDKP
jgi:hypothetical protein